MSRTITTARWIPDPPTPKALEEFCNESPMTLLEPEIQNFNLVSVKEEKHINWDKGLVITGAVIPPAFVMATAPIFMGTPLVYGAMAGASIGWVILVMMANMGKARPSGKRRARELNDKG